MAYNMQNWKIVSEHFEDTPFWAAGPIRNVAGNLLTTSNVTSMSYRVTLASDGSEVASAAISPIATYIHDTPKTIVDDSRWTWGGSFNFDFTVPSTCFPSGGVDYIVEFEALDASSVPTVWGWRVTTVERYLA